MGRVRGVPGVGCEDMLCGSVGLRGAGCGTSLGARAVQWGAACHAWRRMQGWCV